MAFGSLVLSAGFAGARLAVGSGHRSCPGWCRSIGSARRRRWRRRPPTIGRPIRRSPGISARFIEQVRSHPGRCDHRAPELAAGLRIHDGPWRRGAERLCPRPMTLSPRSVRQQIAVEVSSVIRASPQLPRRLDRAPLRGRPARRLPNAGPRSSPSRVQLPRDADRAAEEPAWDLRQRHQLVSGSLGNELRQGPIKTAMRLSANPQ